MTDTERDYLEAAKAVAKARVAYAEAFLLRKGRTATSDGMAREQAVVDTQGELDIALAKQEIARLRLQSTV